MLAVSVTNYQYSISTLGAQTNEVTLTPLNVNSSTFGVKATLSVDGMVTAQPLYIPNLTIPSGPNAGVHNVVFVATEHDSVYAFDANSYTLLWHTSFLSNVGAQGVNYLNPFVGGGVTITSVPNSDVGSTDITPEIGVVATPTIDPSTGTMYLTAKTKMVTGGNTFAVQQLYALNITTGLLQTSIGGGVFNIGETQYGGTPLAGYPSSGGYTYIIGPSVAGTGGGSINGVVTYNALRQMERPAVTLDPYGPNGTTQIILAFASHGDNQPYHGWVMAFNAANLTLDGVFNANPDGNDGGTWQSGGPVIVDSSGNLFFETGNGDFGNNSANPPLNAQGFPTTPNYGDSVIKLQFNSATTQNNQDSNGWGLKLTDYFSPWNSSALNSEDNDMASSGLLILPATDGTAAHPELIIARGKSGVVYVLDANNLGKFNSSTDQVVEEIAPGGGYWSNPTYWNNILYGTPSGGNLMQFTVSPGQITTTPVQRSPNGFGFPGATGTISADGNANGVIWEYNYNGGTETLDAYNATNVSQLLYTGPSVNGVKMTVPIVADGQVFAGENGQLQIFGLISAPTAIPPVVTNVTATGVSPSNINVTWTRGATTAANEETDFEIWRSTDPSNQDNYSLVGIATAGTASYLDTTVQPGETYYYEVRSANGLGHSVSVGPASAVAPLGVVGAWADTDVGGPFVPGNASFTANTSASNYFYTVSGNGSTMRGQASTNTAPVDQFNYVYQPVTYSGSGTQSFVAEVSGQTNTNGSASAGIMIRDSLDAGAEFADAIITPSNGALFQYRPSDGASAAGNTSGGPSAGSNYWLQLVRNGNTITAYGDATDDSNLSHWANLGTFTFSSLSNTLYFGMAVTSDVNGTLSSAKFSNATIGSPANPLPGAPTNLQVTVGTGSQLNLSWTDNNNANPTDGYVVFRGAGASPSSFTAIATLSPNATSYFDSGLTNGATYSYYVEAANTSGVSSPTNSLATTIPIPPGTPTDAAGDVGEVNVSNLTTSGLTLTWKLPDSTDTGVNIYRRDTTTSLYSLIASLPAGTTTYTDHNLNPNSDHDYNVQSFNSGGFSGVASTSIITPAVLTAAGNHNAINLSWTAPPSEFDTYVYDVFRSTTPGGEGNTPYAANVSGTTFSDSSVTSGVTYYYTVEPTENGVISGLSNEASASYVAPAATITQVSTPTLNSVSQIKIVFSEPVTGLTRASLSLTRNGGSNLLTSSQAITTTDNLTFTLSNLSTLTTPVGNYTLTFTAAGSNVTDSSGNAPVANASMSFAVIPPNPIATVTPLNPSTVTIGPNSMTIVFDEAVTGLTTSSLSLSRGGSPNLLTAAQTLSTTDNTTYTLNGLGSIDTSGGTYTLTYTAAGSGVHDAQNSPAVANASTSFTVSPTVPQVTGVYVRTDGWQSTFKNYLAANGLGSSTLGFSIPGGSGQLTTIPWSVNVIEVQFNTDVNISASSITLAGSPGGNTVVPLNDPTTTFSYNSTTHVATWDFRQGLLLNKYLLSIPSASVTSKANGQTLDGDWTNGVSYFDSGNGTAGGDFNFRFNVLPGDVDRLGTVTQQEVTDLKAHFLIYFNQPGYDPFMDSTGKGFITGIDLTPVQSNLGATLPSAEPLTAGQFAALSSVATTSQPAASSTTSGSGSSTSSANTPATLSTLTVGAGQTLTLAPVIAPTAATTAGASPTDATIAADAVFADLGSQSSGISKLLQLRLSLLSQKN